MLGVHGSMGIAPTGQFRNVLVFSFRPEADHIDALSIEPDGDAVPEQQRA
ncbi:hypothetical protein [Kaistia granuli]|nr:hypothetical protein [Kaistia granuli]